jgi:hypothetical protein
VFAATAAGQALLEPLEGQAAGLPDHQLAFEAGGVGQLRKGGGPDLRERAGHVRALPRVQQHPGARPAGELGAVVVPPRLRRAGRSGPGMGVVSIGSGRSRS